MAERAVDSGAMTEVTSQRPNRLLEGIGEKSCVLGTSDKEEGRMGGAAEQERCE